MCGRDTRIVRGWVASPKRWVARGCQNCTVGASSLVGSGALLSVVVVDATPGRLKLHVMCNFGYLLGIPAPKALALAPKARYSSQHLSLRRRRGLWGQLFCT